MGLRPRSRLGWGVGVGAACLFFSACALACGAGQPASVGSDSADAHVREYVRLVVALGARDPDSLDFSYAPEDWTRHDRSDPPPLAAIRERALDRAKRLEQATATGEAERWRYLTRQLKAVAARARILEGWRPSFDEESEALFGVVLPSTAGDDAEARQIYRALDRLLPGSLPLSDRYATFQKRTAVPVAKVRAVFDRALTACRERTLQHLRLPEGERVEVSSVHDSPWHAFSRYRGGYHSAIQLNLDFALTVDGALVLACHEGYPGHHTQNSVAEWRLVKGRRLLEFMVQPLFSPQALVAEGAAVHAIDLVFPGREREEFERGILYPLAGLDGHDADRSVAIERLIDRLRMVSARIARSYLDGDLEFARAASALKDRALVPQPDTLLKFLNEFRTYAVTYTYGPDWVRERGRLVDTDDVRARWQRYEAVATQPWAF